MKHVLVTGGSGFIGSHICEALLKKGYAVTAIDNFITGRRENVANFNFHTDFHLLEWDISHGVPEGQMRNLKYGLHGVLHFACPASPVDFQKIPFEILDVDSMGTKHTIELALKHSSRYVLASTSEIYGNPHIHPQTEDYFGNVNTLGPRACYDEAKRFAEAYVSSAMRCKSLNAAIVRIFNTYGPRMRPDDGRIIPEFMNRGLKRESLPVCGTGTQTRSFCYISDLVDGIMKTFEADFKDVLNLGNPDERSVLEIASIIQKLTGYHSQIQFVPARQDDPERRCPEITKANRLLGWNPKTDLMSGLKKTLEYFHQNAYVNTSYVSSEVGVSP
jgi:dTDP-glucose 4,6-dehydratase